MANKKQPINKQSTKQNEIKPLKESQRTFSDQESKSQEKYYISKPKITSQVGNSDNDKKK